MQNKEIFAKEITFLCKILNYQIQATLLETEDSYSVVCFDTDLDHQGIITDDMIIRQYELERETQYCELEFESHISTSSLINVEILEN